MTEPNDWSDEALGRLLTDTLTSHEHLADPDRARQLAAEASVRPARRRWPAYVAAAAAVVLVAGVGVLVSTRGGGTPDADRPSPSPSPSASSGSPSPTDQSCLGPCAFQMNQAKAQVETQRFAQLVPLPDGARQLTSRPQGLPAQPSSVGPSDPSLTVTTWWSVPVSVGVLRTYLNQHSPEGMTNGGGSGYSSGPGEARVYFVDYSQPVSTDPTAYRPVSLAVDLVASGDSTLVQGSAYTAAYTQHPLEAMIDLDHVTTVDIARVASNSQTGHNEPQPPVHWVEPADAQDIASLLAVINGLPGSASPPFYASCPMVQAPVPSDTVTVTEDDGTTVVFHLEPACFNQVDITVNGRKLKATLDPGDLDAVLF